MAYFRFAQGYEAGGYIGFPAAPGRGSSFAQETNNAYEVGLKSDWLNKRLRANVDLFVNEISNLQVSGSKPLAVAPFFFTSTTNAGSATVEGLESQFVAVPTDNLTTHLNLGYLHPRYNKYVSTVCSNVAGVSVDCSGIPFAFAPKWTINLGGDYAMDLPNGLGTAIASADWSYRSTYYASDPPFPGSRQEGFGLVDAGLKFVDPSGRYSLEFFGTNILNRKYRVAYSAPGGVGAISEDQGAPAEWGLRITAKFGPS